MGSSHAAACSNDAVRWWFGARMLKTIDGRWKPTTICRAYSSQSNQADGNNEDGSDFIR